MSECYLIPSRGEVSFSYPPDPPKNNARTHKTKLGPEISAKDDFVHQTYSTQVDAGAREE